MPLAVPPLDEQTQVVTRTQASLRRLDALAAEANREMMLLEERRAALISATVTGKIDVRGLVPETTEAA